MPPAAPGTSDAEVLALLARTDLPSAFERRRLVLAPGVGATTGPAPWAGALVLVEHGRLEVDCAASGCHVFGPGEILVLGALPLVSVRNVGRAAVRLTIVHRQEEPRLGDLPRLLRQLRV